MPLAQRCVRLLVLVAWMALITFWSGQGNLPIDQGMVADSLHGWLLGQMLAWYGILYYGLTEDVRWYAAGLTILALSFLAFPIGRRRGA